MGGCLDEYHPEFRPQTSYRYVQNISYPTTLVQKLLLPPSASSRQAVSTSVAMAPPRSAGSTTPRPGPSEARPTATARTEGRLALSEVARPTGTDLDAQLSASCLAGDTEACRKLAALHVGNRKPGGSLAAPAGYAFDMTVRSFGWRPGSATVAGSNGAAPGTGPRVALGTD